MSVGTLRPSRHQQRASKRGGAAIAAKLFRVDGQVVTLDEIVARTGLDAAEVKRRIKRARSTAHPKALTWEVFE